MTERQRRALAARLRGDIAETTADVFAFGDWAIRN
jgi:hypothetical protein